MACHGWEVDDRAGARRQEWCFLPVLNRSDRNEMILGVGSATLGRGKPLFPRRMLHPVLRLRSVRQIGEGMAVLHYEVRKSTS